MSLTPLIVRAVTAAFCLVSPGPWSAPVSAQDEQPIASFDDLAEVKEVLLDVLAVDSEGRAVAGLGKEDFTVEEDGEALEITGVSFYTTRYAPGEMLQADGSVPASRYFILFFHDQTGKGSIGDYLARQQSKARLACLTWIEEHLLPSDWLAVASYDVRLKVHQDFTQDRLALVKGVKSATSRKNPERGAGRRGRPMPPIGSPSLLRHLVSGKELGRQTRNVYDALRVLAEATGYTVGRKNLLFFSVGFGELDTTGRVSEVDEQLYPPMEHALNDHNVAVYPIDLTPIGVRHLQSRLLRQLAFDTGGHYFRDPIRFLTPLQQVSAENVGYYLISYRSEHPANRSGYQQVVLRSLDPAIQLRARKGYRFGTEQAD